MVSSSPVADPPLSPDRAPTTVEFDALTPRVASLGGRVLVAPFDVQGIARIALIEDAVGAVVGLWQPPR